MADHLGNSRMPPSQVLQFLFFHWSEYLAGTSLFQLIDPCLRPFQRRALLKTSCRPEFGVPRTVIASWSYGLVRDTGAILLDMNPDRAMAERMRDAIEADGDRLTDLHLWRLGPGHLGAIVSVSTAKQRGPDYYRQMLGRFRSLSHVTVEIDSR